MLWPIILPFQITCGVLIAVVIALTLAAPPRAWGRGKRFLLYSAIAFVAFIPSCTGIMMVVDSVRFGDFNYASFDDIPDFRSRRYLPEKAEDIQIRKCFNGYLARYQLSSHEFNAYLDNLWRMYGTDSASEREGGQDEGQAADPESFRMWFGELGWDFPIHAVVYQSPREPDGGGATYIVDAENGIVFQRTSFW